MQRKRVNAPDHGVTRTRLDQHLVDRDLVETRSRARDLIRSGKVLRNGQPVTKPATAVGHGDAITLAPDAYHHVSRAALKLSHALEVSNIDPTGRICLDIGASTGGFTQVLLEAGAARVYAVDVGTRQLHHTLRNHPDVINLEATDARNLDTALIADKPDLLVCDASFISLEKLLPVPLSLMDPAAAELVALIKPQFEVGRDALPRDGVVKSSSDREAVCARITDWLNVQPGWHVNGVQPSPIDGKSGNQEFLLWATRTRTETGSR